MTVSRRTCVKGLALGSFAAPAMLKAQALRPTPSETIGPFYPISRPGDQDFDLTQIAGRRERAIGEVIELSGRVLGIDGHPVSGAIIDVWQANHAGRYTNPNDQNVHLPLDHNFQGSAKLRSGSDGYFRMITVKPGPYPDPSGRMRTRHIHFDITARNYRLTVQMYFPGEQLNDGDVLLSTMASRNRDPAAAICRSIGQNQDGLMAFEWDIILLTA